MVNIIYYQLIHIKKHKVHLKVDVLNVKKHVGDTINLQKTRRQLVEK